MLRVGILAGYSGALACTPVNDLSVYTTPESGAVLTMDAGSGSNVRGPSDGGATAFDLPSAETTGDNPSSSMPSSTPAEVIQEAALDVPAREGPTTIVDAGDGTEPAPEREPAPIASSIPVDGALGVSPDVVLVIDFGHAMDPSTVSSAILSSDLPLAGASFVWNADNSVVRITLAEPLETASGDDPDQVVARCYSYRISDAAIHADGTTLVPSDIGFCTAKRITQTLPAIADPDLSGNFRSDDGYGDGACGRGTNTVCVGDSGFAANSSYRGFLTFDSSVLPEQMLVVEAELRIETLAPAGTPFEDLGELLVEQARFPRIGTEAFQDALPTDVGVVSRAQNAASTLLGDVTALSRDESDRIQLRLRFADDTDQDGLADHIVGLVNGASLTVSYHIP